MYNRIFIFALCVVLCCFVGCRTSETRGTDLSAANRDENIFIDGDDTDVMQSDQAEGSAVAREFSDDDSDSSGKGPDDEDAFDGSGDDDEGSGVAGRTALKLPESPVLATPPPPPHPKEPRPSLPDETSTTPKSEPTQPPSVPQETLVPETPPKMITTERPRGEHPSNTKDNETPNGGNQTPVDMKSDERPTSFFSQPGILAAVIGGAVVGLLCAILLVMFIVYRMRKKDEGSYALDEPKRSPRNTSSYQPPNKEFYA